MHIICVAGARPNFMKVKPVIDALEARGARVTFVHTGQHYDDDMSAVFLAELGLREPDHHLGVGSASHAVQTARVMEAFEPLVASLAPDWVVVVGDVNSTLACALVAAKAPCRLAHVEAGLRSGDWTMPEEVNRAVTDRVADALFAPSADAMGNLAAEGLSGKAHLAGNVMIDTLLANVERARTRTLSVRSGLQRSGYGLVTLHRPANVDDPDVLDGLLGAFGEIAAELPLVWPVHPRAAAAIGGRSLPPGLVTTGPAGYLDCIALEASARIVLTDSGGIQEETTVLGVPCLTLRDTTERPVTVTEGTNRVVGRDPARVVAAALEVLERGVEARKPELWDGKAAERIAKVLLLQ